MKKTMYGWALLAAVSLVFLFGACPDGNVNGGTKPAFITIVNAEQVGGEIDETGNTTAPSTGIRITFSAPVQYLDYTEVEVTGAAVISGDPEGGGTSWSIPIYPFNTGAAYITINRENIDDTPQEVMVYAEDESKPASWIVQANGASGAEITTTLSFTLNRPVSGLTAGSFIITPDGFVSITGVQAESMNMVWVLSVTVYKEELITVKVDAGGVNSEPQTVNVYRDGTIPDYPWNAPYDPYFPDDWNDTGVQTTAYGWPNVVINSYAELDKIKNFGTYLRDSAGIILYEHDGNGSYIFQTNPDGTLIYETDGSGIMYKKDGSGNLVYKLDAPDGEPILDGNGDPIPIPLPKRTQMANPYSSRGGSASSPLIIQFTANCDKTEFNKIAKWGTDVIGEQEIKDPINAILAAIAAQGSSLYTTWDMSACGWDGTFTDAFGDEATANYDYANNSTHRSNANARNRIGTIYFPKGLKALGNEMFRGWTGLASLSFKDCSAVISIGTRAFSGCTAIRRIDFEGAVNLRTIESEAFAAATGLATHNENGVVDLSALTGLTTIGGSAFGTSTGNAGNALMWKLVLPDSPGIDTNNYTFGNESGGVRQVWFRGNASHYFSNNNFHAAMGGTANNAPSGNSAGFGTGTFTNSNRGAKGNNRDLSNRTDKVLEFFYEESLTPTRMYDGYFYHYEQHGYQGFSALIPVKNGQDIYRGQATMTINGPPVPNAPGGTVDVFSEKNNAAQYKIGAMTGGIITLAEPNAAIRETLRGNNTSGSANRGDHPGMKITGDPRNYYTSRNGDDTVNTTGAKGVVFFTSGTGTANTDGFVESATLTAPATASEASGNTNVTHWYWWPWIGNNNNNYSRANPAKAVTVKSMFYQDGSQWKEIKRYGEDTHSRIYSFYEPSYHLDQHEMMWVWVDQDITLYRIGRAGPNAGGAEISDVTLVHGNRQNLYETAPNNVKSQVYRGKAVGVVYNTLNMSLKKGWNQLVTTTRFSDGENDGWDYRCSFKIIRVWAGLMGPFSVFNVNNPDPMSGQPADLTRSDGWAYNSYPKNVKPGPYEGYLPSGKRQYVDDYPEGRKYIPWVNVQ